MSGSAAEPNRAADKLVLLEVGRGLAALAVVAHHAGLATAAFTSHDISGWFNSGALGVDFFFVLSGFIIYHIHHNDPHTATAARRFLGKRIRRIYVPYLPVTLVLIAAYFVLPALSQGNREWSWLTSLTLLPTGSPPALSVAWTLVYEVTFYLFFLLFYTTRYFWWIVAGWVSLVVVKSALGSYGETSLPPLEILLNPLILEFVAGMMAALLYSRLPLAYWRYLVIVGLGGIIVWSFIDGAHRVFFGLALAPLVLGCVMAETKFSLRVPPAALLLGKASYAIYLIHNPVQSLVARAVRNMDNWPVTFAMCCGAGVAAGLLYHLAFEQPALRRLGRLRIPVPELKQSM